MGCPVVFHGAGALAGSLELTLARVAVFWGAPSRGPWAEINAGMGLGYLGSLHTGGTLADCLDLKQTSAKMV